MKTTIDGIEYTIKENSPDNPKLGVKYQVMSVTENADQIEIEKYNFILGEYETEVMTVDQYAASVGIVNSTISVDTAQTVTLARTEGDILPPSNVTAQTYGNLWVFEVSLAKVGDAKPRHKHEFDHLHFISQGAALFEVFGLDGNVAFSKEYDAPSWIKIPRGHDHQITATADNTIGHCIHPMRNENNELIDSSYIDEYTFTPNT